MKTFLIIACVLTVLDVALWIALPRMLAWRGVEMRRRGWRGATLIFETPDADGTPVRLVNVNGTFQSASYISDELWSELVCVYHREMVRAINAAGDARSVLVIGGGGYSLPKYLVTHTKRMRVCVVEIDPQMTEIAREKFFLDRAEEVAGDRLELVCDDGWAWLRSCGRTFDVIVNDAFKGNKPLGELATDEGAALIAAHLSEGGLYLANVRCPLERRKSAPLQEVKAAFGAKFAQVNVLPEYPEEPTAPGNNVVVATNRSLEL